MPGSSLPPVVAVLQGDASQLLATVSMAKAQVESMDDVEGTAQINVDAGDSTEKLEALRAEIDAFGATRATAHVNVDTSGMLSGITPAVLSGLLAGGLADGGDKGGGGGMGIMGMLLFGGGGIAGIGAGFGSILGLMGFGLEHLITTVIGLIGSAMGAIAGGGLLALGAGGTLAVGMGSDMLVGGSTIADTKTLEGLYQQLSNDVAVYGANSAQAAADQAALTAQMTIFGNTAGVKTEAAFSQALVALNTYWDQATSTARVAFVDMVTPLLSIAYTYIPLIASAATRNFGLIQKGLVPLIAYINGPATAVFQELENLFAQRLPTAMNALNQGFQLLVKTIALVAPQTGGLMTSISDFLTKMNTPAGFAKWSADVGKLIFMFHTWWDLLKQVAITIFDLFSNSKGLGTGIVQTLTSMLKTLDKWLTTTGKSSVGRLFEVHKQEVIDLLKALGPLVVAVGKLYLALSPLLISALVAVLKPLTAFLDLVAKNPVTGFIAGVAGLVLASKALRGGFGALVGAMGGWGAIMDALLGPIGLVILAIAGIGAILVESYIHFKAFRDMVNTVVGNVASAFVHLYDWVSSEVQGLQRWLHTHWAQITDDASIAWNIVSTAVKIAWEVITSIIHAALTVIVPILQVAWSVIFNATTIAWTVITTTIRDAVLGIIDVIHGISDVVGFLTGVWKTVTSDISKAVDQIGKIFGGIINAIESPFRTAIAWVVKEWNSTLGSFHVTIPNWVPGLGGDSFGLPKMAQGGPVLAGMPYIVGESGQELFVPRQNGTIVPNGQVGAAGRPIQIVNNYKFNLTGLPQQIVGQIEAAISAHDKQLNQQLRSA